MTLMNVFFPPLHAKRCFAGQPREVNLTVIPDDGGGTLQRYHSPKRNGLTCVEQGHQRASSNASIEGRVQSRPFRRHEIERCRIDINTLCR